MVTLLVHNVNTNLITSCKCIILYSGLFINRILYFIPCTLNLVTNFFSRFICFYSAFSMGPSSEHDVSAIVMENKTRLTSIFHAFLKLLHCNFFAIIFLLFNLTSDNSRSETICLYIRGWSKIKKTCNLKTILQYDIVLCCKIFCC